MYFYVLGLSQEGGNSIVSQIFFVMVVRGETLLAAYLSPPTG